MEDRDESRNDFKDAAGDAHQGPEIVRADPAARRWTLIGLLAILVIGGPLVWWLENRVDWFGWLGDADGLGGSTLTFGVALFVILGLPAWVLGAYLFRVGRRTLASERFPPPGIRVVRDTTVREGTAARTTGMALCVLAGLVVFAGTALPLMMIWILHTFRDGGAAG